MPDQDAMMLIAELDRRVILLEALFARIGVLDIRISRAEQSINQAASKAVEAACDVFDQQDR